jgi:hypothetical protein
MRAIGWFSGLFVALVAAGCPSLPPPVPCGTIPAGGCPSGRGGTCDDPTCARLYDCVDGEWVSVETCSASMDGGVDDGGAGGAPPIDGGPCTPVSIDMTGKAFGCTPDLQEPDCPVEAAEGCAETACSTGCADFYLCTKQGWDQVAFCDDDGQLVVVP